METKQQQTQPEKADASKQTKKNEKKEEELLVWIICIYYVDADDLLCQISI
jgi:hypothetical protein